MIKEHNLICKLSKLEFLFNSANFMGCVEPYKKLFQLLIFNTKFVKNDQNLFRSSKLEIKQQSQKCGMQFRKQKICIQHQQKAKVKQIQQQGKFKFEKNVLWEYNSKAHKNHRNSCQSQHQMYFNQNILQIVQLILKIMCNMFLSSRLQSLKLIKSDIIKTKIIFAYKNNCHSMQYKYIEKQHYSNFHNPYFNNQNILAEMMQDYVELTSSEKSQLQPYKQIYVFLRMINFVEKYFMYDKIDSATYKTEMNKLLEKYNRFTHVIPNYSLQDFVKKFNIPTEDINLAKLVLQRGIHSEQSQSKQTFLFVQATAKFIEVMDILGMNQDNPVIGQLKNPLQDLQIILKKLCGKLGSDFGNKFREFQRMLNNYVRSKSIGQSLLESEYKQIKYIVQSMYSMMQLIIKS